MALSDKNLALHVRLSLRVRQPWNPYSNISHSPFATELEIDICCSKCHIVICSSNNEWKRLEDVSLITPVQKTLFKTIKIAKTQGSLSLETVPEDLRNDIVSEATCAQCGSVLGQVFGDVVHENPLVDRCVTYDALLLAWLISQ